MDKSGAAYPVTFNAPSAGYDSGMTLLDYFAGQALMGLVGINWKEKQDKRLNGIAEVTYAFAAAMIAEKRRRESQ